jgi:hypothetical protein
MKKIVIALSVIATAVAPHAGSAAEGGEVLWWMVGKNMADVKGTTTDGSIMSAVDLGVTDARIRYEATDGSSGYLTLLSLNPLNNTVYEIDGAAGVLVPGQYFADLSGLSGTACNFIIELGNYSNGSWTKSMESAAASYQTLADNRHITKWELMDGSYGTRWNPQTYSVVPEPTGGFLFLVGGALLMLRRKRFRAEV